MKILLLNGAPGSGKDTVASLLKDWSSTTVHLEKFALPMKLSVPLIYGVSREFWEEKLDVPRNKDLPCDEFFGKTPREVQIALSEDLLKPLHGQTVFGELLARRMQHLEKRSMLECVVVSDSGFYHEAKHIIDTFGADRVQLWRVLRQGHTFKGDSRGHVDLKEEGVDCYDIPNDGSMDDLRELVMPLYEALILGREFTKDEEGKPTMDLEAEEDWAIRRRMAAKEAFRQWPEKKIENIRKQENG